MVRSILPVAFGLLSASHAFGATLQCNAIHEFIDLRNQVVHEEAEMKESAQVPDLIVLAADLDGHHFEIQGNPSGEEFLLFITEAPDYTKGIVTNATFNSSGELRVSKVSGTVVHKLACTRK